MSLDFVNISIKNWEKFNPRKDRVNFSWLRLDNNFFQDQAIFNLNDAQKCLFLFFLCECSKKNNPSVEFSIKYISVILGKKNDEIVKDIQCLDKLGVLTAKSRHKTGNVPTNSLATNERNERNERNEVKESLKIAGTNFDFENIYKNYPRKEGKKKGFQVCMKKIQTEQNFHDLKKAVENYSKHCDIMRQEIKYIKHFSTFMGEFEDWVNPDASLLEAPQSKLVNHYANMLREINDEENNHGKFKDVNRATTC